MSQLSYDDEDYYFQISDELESDKEFVLIIYDIVDNRNTTLQLFHKKISYRTF